MTYKRWRTQIRRWRIDLKISEVVVGELTGWRNDRNSNNTCSDCHKETHEIRLCSNALRISCMNKFTFKIATWTDFEQKLADMRKKVVSIQTQLFSSHHNYFSRELFGCAVRYLVVP